MKERESHCRTEQVPRAAAQPPGTLELRREPPSADLRRLLERPHAGTAGGALPPARVVSPWTAGPRCGPAPPSALAAGLGEWVSGAGRAGGGRARVCAAEASHAPAERAEGALPADSRAGTGAEDPGPGAPGSEDAPRPPPPQDGGLSRPALLPTPTPPFATLMLTWRRGWAGQRLETWPLALARPWPLTLSRGPRFIHL